MEDPIITKTEMAALLGRALKTVEDTNYDLYLKIAMFRLEDLLCLTLPKRNLPADLALLLGRCFGTISSEQEANANRGVSSKKVEDFSISFESDADDPMTAFVKENQLLINKYSECVAKVRAGGSCHRDCVRCI